MYSTKNLKNSAFVIVGWLFYNHLLMMVCFLCNIKLNPLVLPLSLLVAIGTLQFFDTTTKIVSQQRLITYGTVISIFIISFIIASITFDLSWDGQWYHQAAIYKLEEGWNPVLNPDVHFKKCNSKSVVHFSKGPWYFAASVFSAFGILEGGKCMNIIVFFALAFSIFTASKAYKLSNFKSSIITLLFVINPMITNEQLTFLVDQLLLSYLLIYIAAIITWLKERDSISLLLAIMAAIGMINTKFNGLVFFAIVSFFVGVYFLVYQRKSVLKYIGVHLGVFVLGVGFFGYNPYITNTQYWGHPFYPVMKFEKNKMALDKPDADEVERLETPPNMKGKSTFTRFFYATFSKPSASAKINAELMVPFTSTPKDWDIYRFHLVRIAGFGPYFSGILILSFILSILVFVYNKEQRWGLVAILGYILFTISLSKHFWIPRFAPHFFYIPIIPILFALIFPIHSNIKKFATVLCVILIVNTAIPIGYHFKWAIKANNTLNNQLTELKQTGKPVKVYCPFFKMAIENRFKNWEIDCEFISKKKLKSTSYTNLVSVVKGYPGTVKFVLPSKDFKSLRED